MTARHAYNIRALLVFDLIEHGSYSFEDARSVFRLPSREAARALHARGRRLNQANPSTVLKACGEKPLMRAGLDAEVVP